MSENNETTNCYGTVVEWTPANASGVIEEDGMSSHTHYNFQSSLEFSVGDRVTFNANDGVASEVALISHTDPLRYGTVVEWTPENASGVVEEDGMSSHTNYNFQSSLEFKVGDRVSFVVSGESVSEVTPLD